MADTLYSPYVGNGGLDPSLLQVVTVPLTAAQINGMFVTPVSLIAAPGAGKAIVVDSAVFSITTTATQFAAGAAANIQYHGGSATSVFGAVTIPAATITAVAGSSNTLLRPIGAATGFALVANTGVDITNITQAFTTGTGTATVTLWYRVVTAL